MWYESVCENHLITHVGIILILGLTFVVPPGIYFHDFREKPGAERMHPQLGGPQGAGG